MANPEHLDILRQGVEAWNKWRKEYSNVVPDLSDEDLSDEDLSHADLGLADLSGVDLMETDLRGAILISADLRNADLCGTDLYDADLRNAILLEAVVGWTNLGNLDLHTVKGLETVHHQGPSTIGIDTIYRSGGNIPESFLRGAGEVQALMTPSSPTCTPWSTILLSSTVASYRTPAKIRSLPSASMPTSKARTSDAGMPLKISRLETSSEYALMSLSGSMINCC